MNIRKTSPLGVRDEKDRHVTGAREEQPAAAAPATAESGQQTTVVAAPAAGDSGLTSIESLYEAESGALERKMRDRRTEAARQRDQARERWRKSVKEAQSASEALAERLKPRDTRNEERQLRRLAAGQALGELLGAMFGGMIGFGKRGQGYVEPAPGLAWNTLQRLQRLQERGVRADQEYRGRMAELVHAHRQEQARMAEAEYRAAEQALRGLDDEADYAARQRLLNYYRMMQEGQRQAGRQAEEDNKQKNRLQLEGTRQRGRIALKNHGLSGDPELDEIAYMLLPKEKTTVANDGFYGERTTTSPYTSYSKPAHNAALAEAGRIKQIKDAYNLNMNQMAALNYVIQKRGVPGKPGYNGASWNKVDELLGNGVPIEYILDTLDNATL